MLLVIVTGACYAMPASTYDVLQLDYYYYYYYYYHHHHYYY